jgi:hypothetical protein
VEDAAAAGVAVTAAAVAVVTWAAVTSAAATWAVAVAADFVVAEVAVVAAAGWACGLEAAAAAAVAAEAVGNGIQPWAGSPFASNGRRPLSSSMHTWNERLSVGVADDEAGVRLLDGCSIALLLPAGRPVLR